MASSAPTHEQAQSPELVRAADGHTATVVQSNGARPADVPGARLSLYHMPGCGYCSVVVDTVRMLGLNVEMRDVGRDKSRKEELIKVRGRGTVPVLCVSVEGAAPQWIPESREIVRYLKHTAGVPDQTPRWFDRVRDLWKLLPWGLLLLGLLMPGMVRPILVGAALAMLGLRGIARGRRNGTINDTVMGGIALALSVGVAIHALIVGH